MGSKRARHDWATSLSFSLSQWLKTHTHTHTHTHTQYIYICKYMNVRIKPYSFVGQELVWLNWVSNHGASTVFMGWCSCSSSFCNPMDCSLPSSSMSIQFSGQEYWSGLPFPTPGDLPNLGIELMSLALAGGFFTTELPGKHIFWDSNCQLLSLFIHRPLL